MNREKQLERALKRLITYIRENNVCDQVAPAWNGAENYMDDYVIHVKSGAWLTLLDQADDALRKDADQ